MAEIAPFRGILYDTNRVEASKILAPPYDVIDADQRRQLEDQHEHNCVRLILPQGDGDAKYANAARTLATWVETGVLTRDDKPAIYRYNQIFTSAELGGREVTRRGFIAAARLHRFDERVILPHERTLKGPKIDRLKLFKATAGHTSQIFTLYSDPEGAADAALAEAEERAPIIDGTTADGTRHVVWRVDDESVIERVVAVIASRNLYIADGHHRYETMLAYRDYRREQDPNDASADFGTVFLANMDDPGLIVLPTHRLVHSLAEFSRDAVLDKAREHFDVVSVAGAATDAATMRAVLEERGASRPTIAMIVPGSTDADLLSFKADLSSATSTERLDVTILHEQILENILGIDRAAQEAKTNLDYIKDTAKALELTAEGKGQACFLMNATPVAQVKAVSDEGGFMPQKSTFFYPKIASGIVFRKLD
jgi:uncharacterized protein (DUF1015 family)